MQIFIYVVSGLVAAVVTFSLQRYGLTAVAASSLVGLTGAGLGLLISNTHIPAVIFAGSFVGMTALHIGSIPLMVAGGAGAGIIYALTLNIFPGYGGRLGTIAFISSVIVISIAAYLFKK